jgi:hypothetical protein
MWLPLRPEIKNERERRASLCFIYRIKKARVQIKSLTTTVFANQTYDLVAM